MEFCSRYEALGMDLPDPATMCPGQCEGIGYYPQGGNDPDATAYERREWEREHRRAHKLVNRIKMAWQFKSLSILWERCDGCHFIKCGECGGTGKAPQ